MKRLTLCIVLLMSSCFLFAFPLVVNAASMELIRPTFLPYVSGAENLHFELKANLDNYYPLLNISFPVHSNVNKKVIMTLPVYGCFCDVDESDIILEVNGEKLTPFVSYSTDLSGIPSSFSYEEVLAMKMSSELPDLSTLCYYYSFSTDGEGSVTFTIPENTVTFTNLTSYAYNFKERQYIVNLQASSEQTILMIGKDLTFIEVSNVFIRKTIMTCSDFLNDVMEVVSVIGQETSLNSEYLKNIIYARFAYYITSGQGNLAVADLIEAPFDYGFTYFEYCIDLPQGESVIKITQPFQYSIDSSYEPEVQNFYITAPVNSKVSVLLDTDRNVLDGETSFEKKDNNYMFHGIVSDHITVNVCASDTPSPLYPTSQTWATIMLLICGVGVIICITLIIVFILN